MCDNELMFVRIKRSVHNGREYQYLQIVESVREGQKVRQKVVGNLGRVDELLSGDGLDKLIRSMVNFSRRLRVIEAGEEAGIDTCRARVWGPALVFGRLWDDQGLPGLIWRLSDGRRHQFDMERVSFALALQRICEPGSDLQGSDWVKTVEADGFDKIELQHMYRTVGWLFENRHALERELFLRDRDLFNQELDLVFLDTTSTYIYRDEETEWARRGFSRDHRPDLPQMVLCVAVDRDGWPISWEVFPGNTADAKAFDATIKKFRERFKIKRVSVVCDRGMISKDAIKLLVEHERSPYDYIFGCRLRRDKEIGEEVLVRGGRYHEVAPNLKVKEVIVDGRRYIVCRNEEEALKDAGSRESIVARLRDKLASGQAKSLVGNLGYRRFLKGSRGSWRIDEEAVKKDERFDGVFVLRTNMELSASEVARTYKGLWRVERTFREEKSTLEVRPIYHHQDDTRIGHIVGSFLALRLEVDLQRRMEDKGKKTPWPDLMRDLKKVKAIHITLDGIPYMVRTDLEGFANDAFLSAGVRVPSRVIQVK
jgi:hypothetical protein